MKKTSACKLPFPRWHLIHQVGLKPGLQEGWQADLCKLPPGVTCSGYSLAKGHNASLPWFLISGTGQCLAAGFPNWTMESGVGRVFGPW